MTNTKIIFLRHADTQKDPSVNAAMWGLSDLGNKQALDLSEDEILKTAEGVYVSSEKKTKLTIEPLVSKINVDIKEDSNFDEVRRGDKFLTKEEFETEKNLQLEDFSYHAFGGESCFEALERFKNQVEHIKSLNENKTIIIVTHGTILTIYLAYIIDIKDPQKIKERWKNTGFGKYAIVKDNVVIKDIVEF